MVSLAEAVPAAESWLADVAVYPAGEKRALIQARSTGAACLVHAAYVELLTQCREFKTLDGHLSAFCHKKQLSGTPLGIEVVQGLRHKLQQLAQEGYLIPQSQIRDLFEEAGRPAPPTRITTLGFPTCNRVETLRISLSSYVEHCQRFGRSPEFVVMDDSPSPGTREAYREMLRGLQRRSGMSIAYAGLEEKTAYVRKLSEAGQIPEEIVSWACIGDLSYSVRTGANRNALLLHTVGECIFSSDDDLICRVGASPGLQEGLTLRSQENFIQYWYYQDRERALEAVPPVEQDILALHEQWLGQDPRVSGASYSRTGQLSLERVDPDFLRRFAMQPGKIILTAHGIVGDISHRTTDFLLYTPEESLDRLVSSEPVYNSARTSREVAQAVNRLTLTENSHSLTGMYVGGLDNRELLPPFTHVGRSQDTAFGNIFRTCFSNAYTVYLPWVLLHAPLEARAYTEPILSEGGWVSLEVPFHEWLQWCIALFSPVQKGTPADHLFQLGRFLEHIGRLSLPAFEEFARHHLWQVEGETVSYLENRLHGEDRHLASYQRDIEAYCSGVRKIMMLPVKQRLRGGAEMVQRALVQFAQILYWWPTMVETARSLRADGYRVAQPV